MNWSRCWSLALLVAASCKSPRSPPPSPLGVLSAWQLPLWQAECSTPVVSENVCGRFPPDRCDGIWHSIQHLQAEIVERDPGASATLKLTCAPEGWGVWTDDVHRIVGLCVADERRGTALSVRLRQFMERHAPDATELDLDDFITGKSLGQRHPVTRDWRWFEAWNMIPKPDSMGLQACIEFRLSR